MPQHYIKKILSARVYDVAIESPLEIAPLLSKRLGNKILLKREDLQPIFSFKLRGAYNKIAQLSLEERQQGVIAASAGNHAQGVALAAARLAIKATIVMPKTTPDIKVASVREFGARVVLYGDSFDEACTHAYELAQEKGFVFIHPYDDPEVIAGQGTVGLEILRQYTDPIDAIFIPVGGGGLIAGIAVYVKYLRPEIQIIGVEAEDSACLLAALQQKKPVCLSQVGLFADGVAVAKIGAEPFKVAKHCVDQVITVTTDEICAAIKDIFDETRSIAEPAGALGVAGLKKYVEITKLKQGTLIAIDSGANMNFDRLRHISERAELGERREAILAVTIPEQPGSFKIFCQALGKRDITEFNYRYAEQSSAHIFVGVQLKGGANERQELINTLVDQGYPVMDMSDNEMAKLHIRHMVGGRTHGVEHEVLYRLEFPERPGALLKFLNHLGQRWNISLFHYRNHGAAYGRVLLGLQIPQREKSQVDKFLTSLGYHYSEETDNPAYKLFL